MLFDKDSFHNRDSTKNLNMNNHSITNLYNIIKGIFGNSKKNDEYQDLENSIFDIVPDGIMVVSLSGFIIAVNKAYYELTGYTEDQILGKHALQLPVAKGITELDNYWSQAKKIFQGGELKGFEFKYRHADGSQRWGEARVCTAKKGAFRGNVIGVIRDITQRKEREVLIDGMMKELQRSNQELDDYTYAVSHDLKAPLRTILSFSNFLMEDYSDELDETGKEYILRMKSASIRMTELIDDLLIISRVGRMNTNIESFDMNVLINEIIDDIKTILDDKNGKIVIGELPNIISQKIWIKQLFANLVNNGIKFNDSSNPTVWIKCIEKEDHYLFSIKDNGIGIEEKHHDKIFKIFQRLHNSEEYQGTGAGLTICKKIVNLIGGDIWLESKVGKGTTFYVSIPKEEVRPEDSASYVHIEEDQSIIQV